MLVNSTTNQWANDVVNSNGGKHIVALPCSPPAGEYLVREFGPDSSQSNPGVKRPSSQVLSRLLFTWHPHTGMLSFTWVRHGPLVPLPPSAHRHPPKLASRSRLPLGLMPTHQRSLCQALKRLLTPVSLLITRNLIRLRLESPLLTNESHR